MEERYVWKYKEQVYREAIIDRDNEIYRLNQEIETLKNKQKVYIGLNVKCSETTTELAFPSFRKYDGSNA